MNGPDSTEHLGDQVSLFSPQPAVAGAGLGVLAGTLAMVCVGSSVAVSATLVDAPVFTAQTVRYALACLLLLVFARARRGSGHRGRTRRRQPRIHWCGWASPWSWGASFSACHPGRPDTVPRITDKAPTMPFALATLDLNVG